MKLFLKFLSMHIKSQMQYKISFILTFIVQFFVFFSFYFSIFALFQRFGNIKGFTLFEVLLCFSVIQIGYSVTECFARGFDSFDKQIVTGDFDRLLVRPRNLFLQVLGTNIAYDRFGRLIQAFVILGVSIINVKTDWTFDKIMVLLLMLLGSVCVFSGIFILSASFCFLTVQGLEVRNIFTDGGREMAQYPMGIYRKEFLYFFTFIIPLSCINFYPLLVVLGRSDNLLYSVSPLAGCLFLIFSMFVFHSGIKKYQSTGS